MKQSYGFVKFGTSPGAEGEDVLCAIMCPLILTIDFCWGSLEIEKKTWVDFSDFGQIGCNSRWLPHHYNQCNSKRCLGVLTQVFWLKESVKIIYRAKKYGLTMKSNMANNVTAAHFHLAHQNSELCFMITHKTPQNYVK